VIDGYLEIQEIKIICSKQSVCPCKTIEDCQHLKAHKYMGQACDGGICAFINEPVVCIAVKPADQTAFSQIKTLMGVTKGGLA
jgi:hypothetical protein